VNRGAVKQQPEFSVGGIGNLVDAEKAARDSTVVRPGSQAWLGECQRERPNTRAGVVLLQQHRTPSAISNLETRSLYRRKAPGSCECIPQDGDQGKAAPGGGNTSEGPGAERCSRNQDQVLGCVRRHWTISPVKIPRSAADRGYKIKSVNHPIGPPAVQLAMTK
jgi:hypothetical protein